MFCINCGTKNVDNSSFCIGCGKPLKTKRNRSKTWLKVLVGIIIAAGLSLLGIFIFMNQNNKQLESVGYSSIENGNKSNSSLYDGDAPVVSNDNKMADSDFVISMDTMDVYTSDMPEMMQERMALAKSIDTFCSENLRQFDFSFYYTDSSGYEYCYNSHDTRAGASCRIFVIEYIMDAISAGTMENSQRLLDTIEVTMTGDEPSSHDLVEMITGDFNTGLDLVSSYVKERGYDNTLVNRFYGDTGNNMNDTPNHTSAQDIGQCMLHIYEEAHQGSEFARAVLGIFYVQKPSDQSMAGGIFRTDVSAFVYSFPAAYLGWENDVILVEDMGTDTVAVISFMVQDIGESEADHSYVRSCMAELAGLVWPVVNKN